MYLIISTLLLAGCRTKTNVIEVPVNSTEKIIEKLVPVEVSGDSALISALFWCDSLSNVQMMLIDELKSKGMNTSLIFQNGLLTYRAHTKATTHYLPYKIVQRENDKVVKVEVPVITNKLNWHQKLFYYIGIITSVSLITWVIARFTIKR